jgi:hypothetical protein
LHVFIVTGAVLMTTAILFLLISLDKPYQGEFTVGPEMFNAVLHFIDKKS